MNKKLLLLFLLCSATSSIFSDNFFAEKVGDNWPEELRGWRQPTNVENCKSRYLNQDVLGRDIAEVTTPRGVQFHFYKAKGKNGEISETVRRVGANNEVVLVKVFNKVSNETTFIWQEQADFIKTCVGADQLNVLSDNIPILYDGTKPAPDEDPFEKKIKQVSPQLEKIYEECIADVGSLKDLSVDCIDDLNDDREIIEARDRVHDCSQSKHGEETQDNVVDVSELHQSEIAISELFSNLAPHTIPVLGATALISLGFYLFHYVKQGEYYLSRSSLWSSWKPEESLDVLLSVSLDFFVSELKKDIDAQYYSQRDPVNCFLHDIEKEENEIESWLIFRDKLSVLFGKYAYGLYNSAEMRLALLSRMRKAALLLREK